VGKHWWDLDNLVQDADDIYHDTERLLGQGIDGLAHGAGAVLDSVGLRGAGDAVRHWGDEVADQLGATPDEKSLGQTHDPRELVHGDPGAMRDRAGKLNGFHDSFQSAGEGLRGMSVGNFTGRMADAYHHAVETEYPKWLTAADASTAGAKALTDLAEAVEWAQGRAAEAIRVWDEAQRKHDEWQQKHDDYVNGDSDTDPGEDPGPALRQQANDVLTAAREHRNSAAASAASALNNAAGEAPPLPPPSQRLLDDAEDVYNTAGMFDSHMVVGLAQAGTGLVRLVRTVDPTNPYNLAHPAQYVANVAGVDAGLVKMAAHPDELIKGFIGTGWKDDPGQATGHFLANLIPFGPKGTGMVRSLLSDTLESGARGAARDGLEGGVRDFATHTPHVPEAPHAVEPPRAAPSEHAPVEPGPTAGVHDAPAPAEHPPIERAPEPEPAPAEPGPAPAEHTAPPAEQAPPVEHTAPTEPAARPEPPADHGPALDFQQHGPPGGTEHASPLDRGPAPEPLSEPARPPETSQPPAATEPAGPHGGDDGGPGPSGPPSETVKPVEPPADSHSGTPAQDAPAAPHGGTEVDGRPHAPDGTDPGHPRGDGLVDGGEHRPPPAAHLPDGEKAPGHTDPAAAPPPQPHPGRVGPAADEPHPVPRGHGDHGPRAEAEQPKPTSREPGGRDGSAARETPPRDGATPSEKPAAARPSGNSRAPSTAARVSEAADRHEPVAVSKAGPHEPVAHDQPHDGHPGEGGPGDHHRPVDAADEQNLHPLADGDGAGGPGGVAGSIRSVNPGAGTMNCVNCVITTDQMLDGAKVSAALDGPKPVNFLETYFGSHFAPVADRAAIEAAMTAAGDGSRGVVFASRGPGRVGHVFNVINQGGVIRFLDGQTGKVASFGGYRDFFFMRYR
jgi:hypothetical protein